MTDMNNGKKISVVFCPADPNYDPRVIEIEDDLKTLQKLVGGYVEEVTLYGIEDGHYVVLCDKDSRMKRKTQNGLICGYVLVGDIIVARRTSGELDSVKKNFLKRFKENYWTDLRDG